MFKEDAVFGPVSPLIHRPGWLFAQTCQSWWADRMDELPVCNLLVYKSPLVTCHKQMYQPIKDLILGANRFEVVAQGTRIDDNMIHGDKGAEWFFARMTDADDFPAGPVDMGDVRKMISTAVDGALTDSIGKGMAAA
ncbi:hypothetical protein PBI_MISSWHITE_73 [Mycobacterium phage MissWhite]|nr:hypothetical protein PBI_MISSWHITE_73 [Mycobacterium phage MissWhite]